MVYLLTIDCESLNSIYVVSSEILAKDKLISIKHLTKTDVSKNFVNSEHFSDSKSSFHDQHNPGSI